MKKLWLLVFALLLAAPLPAQIDTTKWYPLDNQTNSAGGACHFTGLNVVSGGFLTETMNSGSYSCGGLTGVPNEEGFIVSKAFSFTYGVVKARARFGQLGNSIWSAVWMWGGGSTSLGYPPTCIAALEAGGRAMSSCTLGSAVLSYEVDIAESPSGTGTIRQNYITWNNGTPTSTPTTTTTGNPANAYHIYELDWFPTVLVFKIDGQITNTISTSLSVPMFLLIDQEADSGLPTSFPNTTSVDWIRVCSDANATCNPGDPTMIFEDEFNEGVVTTPIAHTIQGRTVQGGTVQ
jgi:beta-glucanase (GH16 family)